MRRAHLSLAGLVLLVTPSLYAITADEIIANYIKTVGGIEKINAVKSIRRTGKFTGGGGFEAVVVEEAKRPNMVRQEFSLQGMTAVTAYDGSTGWKIEPWQGKKDVESLSEDEMKGIVFDSDFDGPLVNYKQKGHTVEYVGLDPVDGTDTHKLKVTMKSGDVVHYYMDTDYFVPIKVELKRTVRGEEREYEQILGDYKEVGGWYLPHSIENGAKGSSFRAQVSYDKIEPNPTLDDNRFHRPAAPAKGK